MNIFIDTNSYFAPFGKEADTSSFLRLKKILEEHKDKYKLIITEQVISEFERNIGSKIEKARVAKTKEVDEKFKFTTDISKENEPKYKESLEKIRLEIEKNRQAELDVFEKDVASAEKELQELFKMAKVIPYDDKILENAKLRHLKGNPPKKDDNSYGDAINWESLLSLTEQDDLIVITADADYYEVFKESKKVPQRFLEQEWAKATGKKINIYPALGMFTNRVEGKKVIPDTTIKEEIKRSASPTRVFIPINEPFMVDGSQTVYFNPQNGSALTYPYFDNTLASNSIGLDETIYGLGSNHLAYANPTNEVFFQNNLQENYLTATGGYNLNPDIAIPLYDPNLTGPYHLNPDQLIYSEPNVDISKMLGSHKITPEDEQLFNPHMMK